MTAVARTGAPPSTAAQRRGGSSVTAVVVAVVVGLAVGRFLTPPAEAPAAPIGVRSLPDRIVGLEARVAASPDDADALAALAEAHLQAVEETGDATSLTLAERALDRLDDDADLPATTLLRGRLALARHDFAAARRWGEAATRAMPHRAASWGLLVDARIELGDYEQAATDLQRMIDLRPGPAALARVSYLRELHGDLPGAVQAMSQAAEAARGTTSPRESAAIAVLLGDLHLKTGDLRSAGREYARAESTVVGHRGAAVGRARVLAARGREKDAVTALQQVTDRAPDAVVAVLLAELATAAGDDAGAAGARELVRALTRLAEAAGQASDLELAGFEADAGTDPDHAVALARRAARQRPGSVFGASVLSWALHRAGDTAAAAPLAHDALRLGTADVALRYRAAAVLAAAGERDAARAALVGAFGLSPSTTPAYRRDAQRLAEQLDVPLPAVWEEAP